MGLLQKEKNRNAAMARNSFVTRKVENKLSVLADTFRQSAGAYCTSVEAGKLSRRLVFDGFGYLKNLDLIYNWENRFLSVNYNLQIATNIEVNDRFIETGDCAFEVEFKLKGAKWSCRRWTGTDNTAMKEEYLGRLSNPLIMDRLRELDIVDLEISHRRDQGTFYISMESMIGSATWIFIPPITNLITPRQEECVRFFELFELLGDAVVNNAADNAAADNAAAENEATGSTAADNTAAGNAAENNVATNDSD